MNLLVCPAATLAETARRERPSHIVTTASPGVQLPPVPPGTAHLHLAFNDVSGPTPPLSFRSRPRIFPSGIPRAGSARPGTHDRAPEPECGFRALACGEPRNHGGGGIEPISPTRPILPPSREDVAALLAFGRSWSGSRPLLVACELGVSRSPAAAFVLACQALAAVAPGDIAQALRRASPQATPNPLVVALADAILGRRGVMVDAVAAIGRGADYAGPAPFRLALSAPALRG